MRFKTFFAGAAAVALLVGPAAACENGRLHKRVAASRAQVWQRILTAAVEWPPIEEKVRLARADSKPREQRATDLTAFEGVAAWVDIFDAGPWDHPARMVRNLHRRGVKAIFVQTSTYGRTRPVLHEDELSTMLEVAHKRDMHVVSWYVPSFAKMKTDLRRSMKAVNFRSDEGERFDSFALDIESTVVGNVAVRNERLLRLTDRIRRRTGNGYTLGAITPDPQASLYWPNFPWKRIGNRYDVIVPMSYFSFFTDGYREVRSYMEKDIAYIKRETSDPKIPIHVIGGIADDAEPREVRGFVHASRKHNVLGASLYDSPITTPESWRILSSFEMGGPVPDGKLDLGKDDEPKKDRRGETKAHAKKRGKSTKHDKDKRGAKSKKLERKVRREGRRLKDRIDRR